MHTVQFRKPASRFWPENPAVDSGVRAFGPNLAPIGRIWMKANLFESDHYGWPYRDDGGCVRRSGKLQAASGWKCRQYQALTVSSGTKMPVSHLLPQSRIKHPAMMRPCLLNMAAWSCSGAFLQTARKSRHHMGDSSGGLGITGGKFGEITSTCQTGM